MDQLHPHLMMQSLNAHGAEAFGLEPLDVRKLMQLIRLLDNVYQASALENTVGNLPARNKEILRDSGTIDVTTPTVITVSRIAVMTHPVDLNQKLLWKNNTIIF